ncbi:response regulator [Actinophytocola sp.]|uniref:response regulator n=1 Tax=Actinophytocola sp. TaxID=1872138 RepID=UPI002ED405AE
MPRPERPVESAHADLAKLALGLRELRTQAGGTYRDLSCRTGYAISVLSEAASGRRLPTWDVVKAYVEACDGDPGEWHQVWINAAEELRRPKVHSAQSDEEPHQGKGAGYAHAGALINLQPALPVEQGSGASKDQSPDVAPATSPIRIFLVDDHEVVRRGVADLFEDEPDLTIVGDAADVTSALATIPNHNVDVAVLDVRMPDGNGIELCRDLRSQLPELRCLILTSYSDDEAMLNAIMAGASGYVLKQVLGAELIAAVRKVAAGESLLDARMTQALMARIRQGEGQGPLAGLTDQERAVFDLVGEGMTNKQIAQRLFLAEKTVKNYVSHILAKLGMQRRTQASALAAELKSRDHVIRSDRDEKQVSTHTGRGRVLSPEVEQQILELAQRPGWSAERVFAHLRSKYNRHDISLGVIRRVLARAPVREKRRFSRR